MRSPSAAAALVLLPLGVLGGGLGVVLGTVAGAVVGGVVVLAVLAGESEVLVEDELAGDGVAGGEEGEADDDTCRD